MGTITRSGFMPYAVAVYETGNKVFIADNSTGNLFIFDGTTLAQLGYVAVGTGVSSIVVHEATGKLYAASNTARKVTVVDAANNALIRVLPGHYSNSPRLALDAGLAKVYALSLEGMQQIDIATDSQTNIPGFGSPNDLDQMAVNPVTHEIFVSRSVQNVLAVVDPVTLGRTTYPLMGGLGVAVNWNENKAYVLKAGGGGLAILDRDTGSTSSLLTGNDATKALFVPAVNRMYTDSEVNAISTIVGGTANTFFNLPMLPRATALDVRQSANHVYYAGQNFIGVVDDATQLTEIIPVTNPAPASTIVQSIAINQTTGRVYTVNDGNALSFVTVVQDSGAMTRSPVYLGSKGSSRTYVLDPVSKTLVDKWVSHPGYADAVRPGGGRVYEATYQSGAVNGELREYAGAGTATLIAAFGTGGVYPTTPVITPDGSRIYVTNSSSGNVSVIDAASNSLISTISTDVTPWGAAMSPDGTQVYVTNRDANNVSVISTISDSVTATIPVGAAPWGVAITPSGTRAYVANSGGASVSVIDTATASVIATVNVGVNPHWLAVTPDGRSVFVGNRGGPSVSVIDTGGNTVVQTVPVTMNPEGIGVLPDGSQVLVVDSNVSAASSVSVIDATTYEVEAIAMPRDSIETIALAIADPTSKFAGRVTRDGTALSGVQLQALQGGVVMGTATTNATGDYSIFNLNAGTYDIEASAAGYVTQIAQGQRVGVGRNTLVSFALIGAAPAVKLDPASLTFPNQVVKTRSHAKTVTLTNTGNADLAISSITTSPGFTQSNTCGSGLTAGESCTISVFFRAVAKGPLSGTLTIADNAAGSPHAVNLSGTGTIVGLAPGAIDFGPVAVGHSSAPSKVTLTNQGAGPLTITSIVLGGTNPGNFTLSGTCPISPTKLAGGKSCTMTVTFKPKTQGAKSGAVVIIDDGGGSPQGVAMTGSGT